MASERPASVPGYTLLRGLDVDRVGALVEAREDATGRAVVIRLLSPAVAADSRYMRRLTAVVPRLRALRNANLVQLLAFQRRPAALVYEHLDGVSLRRLIDERGALPHDAAFVLMDDCLTALAVLHGAGIQHRDVRPECILVERRGLACLRDAEVPSPPLRAGWRSGTPQYMAPELWAGRQHSAESDFYAAACVFFEALTGRPPFAAPDIEGLRRQHRIGAVPQDVGPAPLRLLLSEGINPDPEERAREASRFRADLATTADSLQGEGWRDRGRAWLAAAAADLAAAPPPPVYVVPPVTAAPPLGDVVTTTVEESRPSWWTGTKIWAAVLGALAALALLVVVVAAATGTGSDNGVVGPPVPSSSPTAAGPASPPFTSSAAPSSSVTSGTTPPVTPATPSVIAPDTAQPTVRPATSPTPHGGPHSPSPSPTACRPVPIC